MRPRINSFEVRAGPTSRVLEALLKQDTPPGATTLVFLSGALASELPELARRLALMRPSGEYLFGAAAGVLTERGEVLGEPACVGLTLPGVRTKLLLGEGADASFGGRLGRELETARGSAAFVLLAGDKLEDGWLSELTRASKTSGARLFGGGTLAGVKLHAVGSGEVRTGAAAALLIERPHQGRVAASAACRLLCPLSRVTRTRGNLVLELDGLPALSVLTTASAGLEENPLILLALAMGANALSPEGRKLAMRPITGIDPERGGILLASALPLGARVAFAVRDAHAARSDLDAHLRTLRLSCAGTAPAFGLYANCSGRARSLHAAPDVDVKLIRQHFPGMPLVGLHSAFELAPLDGLLTPQLYAGVLGVFCSPS